MIDDILFDFSDFILELPNGAVGSNGESYSMDGVNYDYNNIIIYTSSTETSSIFVN
jgi:hypothetical protein